METDYMMEVARRLVNTARTDEGWTCVAAELERMLDSPDPRERAFALAVRFALADEALAEMGRDNVGPFCTYVLVADGETRPFNVGLTRDPDRRLRMHLSSARLQDRSPVAARIADLAREDRGIRMEVVAEGLSKSKAQVAEAALIGQLHAAGVPLANRTLLEGRTLTKAEADHRWYWRAPEWSRALGRERNRRRAAKGGGPMT